MAKLKAVVPKIEEVVEGAREYYTKGEDGRFYLDAEGIDDMPAVIGLKKNRDDLKAEKKQLEEKRNADIALLDAKIADLEKGNKGGKNDEKIAELENRMKQLSEKTATDLAAKDAEIEKERAANRRSFLDREITRALAAQGGNPELLSHIVEKAVKVERVGEAFKVNVIDKDGNARIKNSLNEIVSLDDYVGELKKNEKYLGAFAPTGAGGSGAPAGGSKGDGAAPKTIKRSDEKAMSQNIRAIARGEVKVVDG